MHSARVVVLIVAVGCACDLRHVSAVPTKNRSRNIFALLKAGNGLAANRQQTTQIYQRKNSIPYGGTQSGGGGGGNGHAVPSKRSDVDTGQGRGADPDGSRPDLAVLEPDEGMFDDGLDIGSTFGYIVDREGQLGAAEIEQKMRAAMKPQNFLRRARSSSSSARPYDVPIIECPPADDQMERFPCPRPDRKGRYRCIDDHVLCDGFIDCPDGMDEDRQQCMFYKTTKAHLDVIADAIIRFIRGRKK